jgi:predicted metal-dependent hydrolase
VKLTETQAKKYVDFLNKHKHRFGLGEYRVFVKQQVPKRDTPVAETGYDYYEKDLTIELSTIFMKADESRQRNILIHELIHTQYGVMKQRADKLAYEYEEEMVNTLTNQVMSIQGVDEW